MRLGTETFFTHQLSRISKTKGSIKILDVGCGWGQHIADPEHHHFYGVDIEGFPKAMTLEKGYKEAREYAENNAIYYNNVSFDVALLINVNAHLPDELLSSLLSEVAKKLKPKEP